MYIFDTNVFISMGFYYRSKFPTLWEGIDSLALSGELCSVREVRRELDERNAVIHIDEWVKKNNSIFKIPDKEEYVVVASLFKNEQFRGLVKRKNIQRGMPVADPFIIAAAKVYGGVVVTQESLNPGARIPYICSELGVESINLEEFLGREDFKY